MQSIYSLSEGSGVVSVCVVLDGIIERNVQVELSTIDETATGISRHISLTSFSSHLSS